MGTLSLETLKTMVDNLNAPAELEDGVKNLLDAFAGSIQYSFPILDDPVYAAVNLLMGNDFKLFELKGLASTEHADAPKFEFCTFLG